jgi:hypothetical protein
VPRSASLLVGPKSVSLPGLFSQLRWCSWRLQREIAAFLRQPGMLAAVNMLLSGSEQKPTCCALPFLRYGSSFCTANRQCMLQ